MTENHDPTGAERYFAGRMQDPEYRTTYAALTRRARGSLELDIKSVCDIFIHSPMLFGGKPATAQRIAKQIAATMPSYNKPPTAGSVQDALVRWEKIGYAVLTEKPLAFGYYGADAFTRGLDGCHQQYAFTKASKAGPRERTVKR